MELPNQETRKVERKSCEFWLEFESKARMHIAMEDPAATQSESYLDDIKALIPPLGEYALDAALRTSKSIKKVELGSVDRDQINVEDNGTAGAEADVTSQAKKSIVTNAESRLSHAKDPTGDPSEAP